MDTEEKRARLPRKSPIHMASLDGDVERLRAIVESGGEVDKVWADGITALTLAVDSKNPEAAQYLLSVGADYRVKSTSDGRSLLHDAANRGETEIMIILLDLGLDPNERDLRGRTPLHFAASCLHPHISAVLELIERGALVDAKNEDGSTPLMAAVPPMNFEACYVLAQAGANLALRHSDGFTALELAETNLRWYEQEQDRSRDGFQFERESTAEVIRILKRFERLAEQA